MTGSGVIRRFDFFSFETNIPFYPACRRVFIDRRHAGTERRITPEPVIGPRLARTRWAPIRPTATCAARREAEVTATLPFRLTGKSPRSRCPHPTYLLSPSRKNILLFRIFGLSYYPSLSRPTKKGRIMIVANAGRDAVDADGASDEGAWSGRRSRVVLAPRRWCQVGV